MFVFKNSALSLGSLLLLDWFVIELVAISYCLYDVFYNSKQLTPKHAAIAYVHRTPKDTTSVQSKAIKSPDDMYVIDTAYQMTNCFDTPPSNDTTVLILSHLKQKIYDSDSVDEKVDLKQLTDIIIYTFEHYLTIDEISYAGHFTLAFTVGTEGAISNIQIEPFQINGNKLLQQFQIALTNSKAIKPAKLKGVAVACRYKFPFYLCMDDD